MDDSGYVTSVDGDIQLLVVDRRSAFKVDRCCFRCGEGGGDAVSVLVVDHDFGLVIVWLERSKEEDRRC